MTHFGIQSQKHCGESSLSPGDATTDIQAVTCLTCLWKLLQESMLATDRIAFRIKLVTDEERNARAQQLVLGAARARG